MRDAEQAVLTLRDKPARLWLQLGGAPFEGAPTSELLSRLRTMIEEREAALGERQRARRLAADTVASLIVLSREVADRKVRREEVEKILLAMRHRKDEADKADRPRQGSRQADARGEGARRP